MLRFLKLFLAIAIASTLGMTADAHAATYYVSTSGNDSNRGTESAPWRTVAHAVSTMVAGDTTYVRGGIYREGLIRFRRSGTRSAPIRLLAEPGESPVIQCIDAEAIHRIIIQHGSGAALNPMGWITIEGFEIANCYNGIKFHNLHDSVIRGNWIHDSRSQGILGNGTRVQIEANTISDNGRTLTTLDHGMYVNGSNITVTNNLIYGNATFGIQLNGSGSSSYSSDYHPSREFAVSENWLIANNTIAYQQQAAAIVVWGATCNDTRIENNIFYENRTAASGGGANGVHFVSTRCTGIRIRNNLSYSSRGFPLLGTGATEGTHYTLSGNIVGNPRFIDAPSSVPAVPNFRLSPDSPAIDAGRNLASDGVTTDFDGGARADGAHDVGAFEFGSTTMPPPPDGDCGTQFGSLLGYQLCEERAAECEMALRTGGTCRDSCAAAGRACITGYDENESVGACERSTEVGCDTHYITQICVCSFDAAPMTEPDASPTDPDAGASDPDAGMPMFDSGPDPDAGSPAIDAGTVDGGDPSATCWLVEHTLPDGGRGTATLECEYEANGCAAGGAGASGAFFVVLALIVRRRRDCTWMFGGSR